MDEIVIFNDNLSQNTLVLQELIARQDDLSAFQELDEWIVKSFRWREAAGSILCASLAALKERWESGRVSTVDMSQYDYSFYQYAYEKTGYARSTIDNMVDVGRTWLMGELPEGIPESVEIYDKDGSPTGDVITIDPYQIATSKLLVAKAAAKDGSLARNPAALGQLVNADVPVAIVRDTLRGTASNGNGKLEKSNRLRLFFEGDFLCAQRGGGEVEVVAEFYPVSDITREAMLYISAACKVRM